MPRFRLKITEIKNAKNVSWMLLKIQRKQTRASLEARNKGAVFH
jgi:hypothetical protein